MKPRLVFVTLLVLALAVSTHMLAQGGAAIPGSPVAVAQAKERWVVSWLGAAQGPYPVVTHRRNPICALHSHPQKPGRETRHYGLLSGLMCGNTGSAAAHECLRNQSQSGSMVYLLAFNSAVPRWSREPTDR